MDALEEKLKFVEEMKIPLSQLKFPLQDYQKKGVNFLIIFRRGILNFSIGLGKTCIAIAAAKTILDKYPGRFLIVCPSSIKYSIWEKEIKKFLGEESVTVVDGTFEERKKQYSAKTLFVVTSYELIRMSKEIEYITSLDWKGIILDEITRVKNHKSLTFKSVCKLQKYKYLFGLTGCSIENNIEDLYSVVSSVNPFIFPSWNRFKKDFLITELQKVWNPKKKKNQYIEKIIGQKNLQKLKHYLKFAFYILNREETGIKFHGVKKLLYEIEPSRQELDAYQKIVEMKNSIFARIVLLKEAVNYLEQLPEQIGIETKSSKAAELVKVVKEIGSKVIIFTQFAKTLRLLERDLAVLGRPIITVTGEDDSAQEKADKIALFERDLTDTIMICTDCLAYGSNLQFCHVLINFDTLWNPIAMEQRNGRIDRRGQQEDVVIINFIVKNSIEEKVWEVINRKQELIKFLVGLEFGPYLQTDSEFLKWLTGIIN
jgi:SNF2 family DNA or RNA helicase